MSGLVRTMAVMMVFLAAATRSAESQDQPVDCRSGLRGGVVIDCSATGTPRAQLRAERQASSNSSDIGGAVRQYLNAEAAYLEAAAVPTASPKDAAMVPTITEADVDSALGYYVQAHKRRSQRRHTIFASSVMTRFGPANFGKHR